MYLYSLIFNFKQLSAYAQALKSTSTDVAELSKLTSLLTTEQTINALSSKGLTDQQVVQILMNKGIVKSEAEAIASKMVSSTANGIVTFSFKAYTAAIWENIKALIAWMASNPVGWIIGIGAAIGGAVIAYNLFDESIEEQKEKLKDLEEEYKATKNELESLRAELENNIKLIKELQDKKINGSITLVEEDQLEKLKFQNSLLSQQVKLQENLEKKAKAKLIKKNRETFNNEFGGSFTEGNEQNTNIHDKYGVVFAQTKLQDDKTLIL